MCACVSLSVAVLRRVVCCRQTNTPIYPPFLWTPKTAGMGVQQVPLVLDEAGGKWDMDFKKMEALVSPRTKMFLLCNPHNPVRHP